MRSARTGLGVWATRCQTNASLIKCCGHKQQGVLIPPPLSFPAPPFIVTAFFSDPSSAGATPLCRPNRHPSILHRKGPNFGNKISGIIYFLVCLHSYIWEQFHLETPAPSPIILKSHVVFNRVKHKQRRAECVIWSVQILCTKNKKKKRIFSGSMLCRILIIMVAMNNHGALRGSRRHFELS